MNWKIMMSIANAIGADTQRWDVAEPAFLFTILRVMLGMWVLVVGVGTLVSHAAFLGLCSGGALGIGLYLAAIQTGRVFTHSKHFGRTMLSSIGMQGVLWIAMALLIVVIKVDLAGFAVGASVLPAAIVLTTLYWWLIVHKGSLS